MCPRRRGPKQCSTVQSKGKGNRMAYVRRDEMPFFNPTLQPRFGFTAPNYDPAQETIPQQPPVTWGEIIIGGLVLGGLAYIAYKAFSGADTSARHCSVCDSINHDRRTCPYDGPRIAFSRSIPMSAICECCGEYPAVQRHHTRGRSDDSDKLDVCVGCHLHCCHNGHWQNFPTKPRNCMFTGGKSIWRAA